jgi:hypothetical protein
MEGGAVGHNIEMGIPKDYPCQVWFNLVQRLITFKSSPLKSLNQIKANLAGMVLGWSPFNIVSDSPALHSKWLLLLKIEISLVVLKWEYPRTIPARFGLIWFSGFRGKDLNVIFYQNMSNLHNRYKSVHSRWLLLLKIEISSIVHCCFIINQNELKF